MFTLQAKEGQDPELKTFAVQQLPVLREHLQQVRTLAARHAAGKAPEAAGQRSMR